MYEDSDIRIELAGGKPFFVLVGVHLKKPKDEIAGSIDDYAREALERYVRANPEHPMCVSEVFGLDGKTMNGKSYTCAANAPAVTELLIVRPGS